MKKNPFLQSKKRNILININNNDSRFSLHDNMSPIISPSVITEKRYGEKNFFITHEFLNFNNLNNSMDPKDSIRGDSKQLNPLHYI